MAHALLAPSSAARIVACPGSRKMEANYPDDDTEDAREGTASHEAMANLLRNIPVAVGDVMSNGIILTNEMLDGARMFANYVKARGPVGHVEEVTMHPVLHGDNWGTPDHWAFADDFSTLHVDDYKYGHKFVSPMRHWQCLNYAALILAKHGLHNRDNLRIIITIVQPRSYHVSGPIRTWSLTVGEARQYWAMLSEAFHVAMRDDAPCIASDPDACDDCKGRHDCMAVTAAANWGVDVSYASLPLHMTPEAQALERRKLLRAEKFIKAKREGIEQAIMMQIKRGASVPFFGIEHNPGRLVFKDDATKTGLLEAARALDIPIEKPGLITPKQAIDAGMPEALVMSYTKRNSGSAVLVEHDPDEAARIFGSK